MGSSIRLGRVAGIEIGANWSWVAVFALIAWSLADGVFPTTNPGHARATYWAMAVVAAALFFASLLLHELGHAVRARREGMRIDGITLWLFGGVAKLGSAIPSAGTEFRVAIAGPLVSLAIGAALVLLSALAPLPGAADGIAAWIGYSNLILLVFNLMPALPLDGGRVLRAGLWRLRDFAWATTVAARIGQGIGGLVIAGGLVLLAVQGAYSGLWLAFVGWFLFQAASAERRAALGTPPDFTLERLAEEAVRRGGVASVPLVVEGRVATQAVFRPAAGEAAGPLPRVELRTPLATAFEDVARAGETRALVVDDGRVVGLLGFSRPLPWAFLLPGRRRPV